MIHLVQTSNEEKVTVSMEDKGCGMNGTTIKRIFKKFYQGKTSHTVKGFRFFHSTEQAK